MALMYQLTTDRVADESGKVFTVYGVTACTPTGKAVCSVCDLFFDRARAAAFVRTCRAEQPTPTQLWELVEDALAAQYG